MDRGISFLGPQASVVLMLLIQDAFRDEFHDIETVYGNLDLMQASELLELVRSANERLQSLGIPENIPERIRVTSDMRVFLPDRGNAELKMRPLVRSVFILFLRHPEGIVLKRLSAHREELEDIYSIATRRGDPASVTRSIDRLVSVFDNNINVSRTMLKNTLKQFFTDEVLPNYTINGRAGEPMAIPLDRTLVIWE